jgi:hypothetical protein
MDLPIVFGRTGQEVESELPRCPPDADLDQVMIEQFNYLILMAHDRHATPAERDRIGRLMALLLEPFEAHQAPARAMAA